MEEETRSLRGLRTIYTEEQRQWFKDHCVKFSIAQWCVIMNTDKTGVHNMAARFKNIRFKRGAPTTNCDNVLAYKHEFERMDWNRKRGVQRTKDVKDSRRKDFAYKEITRALLHDPNEVMERLQLNRFPITWGEYARRMSIYKEL